MEEQTNENPNSDNEGGEGETDLDTLTEEQITEMSAEERLVRVEKQVNEFQTKNKELFARAKKAEERNKRLREAVEEVEKPKAPESVKVTEESRFERYDLRLAGYNEEETEYLMTLGGKKALERQEIKDFMEYKRQKKQSEVKSPSPSSRSAPVLDKTPLRDLSSTKEGQQKLEKNWDQVIAKFKKGGGEQGGVI